jgi:hypothetical protein
MALPAQQGRAGAAPQVQRRTRWEGRPNLRPVRGPHPRPVVPKGAVGVLYGEPDAPRFLAAVQRLKREQRKREQRTRQVKQRLRVRLRKMRG